MRPIKLAFLLLVLMLASCATAPVQEMSDARQAIDAALQVGADSLASIELKSAEVLLQQAEKSLTERQYRQAREQAEAARDQALIAQKKALSQ